MIFIIYKGVLQYIRKAKSSDIKSRSLIPLGAVGLILGIIGYIRGYSQAFEAIEAAADINPQIIANSVGNSIAYPVLGLLILAISFMFQYLNQK